MYRTELAVRIYFEDTDFSGVVYHANYLRYFERGRTESLRTTGMDHHQLFQEEEPLVFTIRDLQVVYHRGARIDDLLTIQTDLVAVKGARLLFEQRALKGDVVLCDAALTVACMNMAGRPKRLPKEMSAAWAKLMSADAN